MEISWKRLLPYNGLALEDARLQLHWAVQIPASIGYTHLASRPDWSHVSLSGIHAGGGFTLISEPAKGNCKFQVGLRLTDLTLFMLVDDKLDEEFGLHNRTLEEGYGWLKETIKPHLGELKERKMVRPDHELPAHPVSTGARFDRSDGKAFELLSKWFQNADSILNEISQSRSEALPVRCWPHHFDIASLLVYDQDKDPEEARSIGVGFIPGDSGYGDPYWYVTPWPYPKGLTLPMLPAGHWHEEGWIGAVLEGANLVKAGESEQQLALLNRFLDAAIGGAKSLLGV